ncbi:MAG: GNAT family N-acetyltransferase [Spirosomaceae bacterium]|jgi:hypothetical protein|nr:GNAT family N-acetyltransferase [Spirosomataceae bacterium]
MLTIKTVSQDSEIKGILALQQKNLKKNLTPEVIASQGFVTVEHKYEVLKAMNDAEPSVIAKDGETVVSYCLAMLSQFGNDVPELKPLFELLDEVVYDGKKLKDYKYFVMGQVCVAEGYRGEGLFDKMYLHLREKLSDRYQLCVTDIARTNTRSQKAHARVGFEFVHEFFDEILNEYWRIVVWDWQK